jgi:hypothetical protein
MQLEPTVFNPDSRPRLEYMPLPAVAPGEYRVSHFFDTTASPVQAAQTNVVGEEHHQAAIVAAMPANWDDRSWPLLVDLAMVDSNPTVASPAPVICVKIGAEPVGYFTPKMTERYGHLVAGACSQGQRVTASAWASQTTKAGETTWQLKVNMPAMTR